MCSAASLPEDADSEACATCGKPGLVTGCDGCGGFKEGQNVICKDLKARPELTTEPAQPE